VRDERAKLNTNLRHVDMHNHWLRQEVLLHHIAIVWESAHQMVADGLTKPLTPAKHTNFVKLLGLEDILETLQTGEAAETRHLRVLDKLQQLKNEGSTEATEGYGWSSHHVLADLTAHPPKMKYGPKSEMQT
jgi:hypothetical protein